MFALSSDLFYFKFILRLETDTFRSHQLPIAPQVGRDLLSLSIICARILTGLTLCRSSASSHSHCAHEYNSPVMSKKTILLQVPTTSGSYNLCSLSSVMLLSLFGKEYDIGVLFRVQYTAVFCSLCAGQVVSLCINFHLPPKRGGGASLMRVKGSTNL